jgi:glycosyltransferase involved in cell wall biosynthesis
MLTDTQTFSTPPIAHALVEVSPKAVRATDAPAIPEKIRPRPRLYVIAPALPPMLDGIGDYTALLSRELSKSIDVTVLGNSAAAADPISGVSIRPTFDPDRRRSVWDIADVVIGELPDALLLQYNPFAYGRWGLNLQLPQVLKCIRRHAPVIPIIVMMHEIYVPFTNWKFAIMASWQRWQFFQIGRNADAVCFSIQPWADQRRYGFCPGAVHHLPVGSNIPRQPITRAEARAKLGLADDEIALGVFGTAHVSRLLEPLRSAARKVASANRRVRVVYIGPHPDAVREALHDVPLIADGPFPADEVSRRLAALDIFLATYADGVSTRRGAMMAALQHGIPVVGTRGHHTDAELIAADGKALLLAPAGDAHAFDAAVLRLALNPEMRGQIAAGGLEMFSRSYSWPAIAAGLTQILQTTRPVDRS